MVKDVNKVIELLTRQNAELTKINAIQAVMLEEKDAELKELQEQEVK